MVGNDAPNFSAGANLMLLLLEAQEGNWDEVDLMVRSFQRATMGLKYAAVPVVVAPAGLALGGGCEIALHGTECRRRQRPTWDWSKSGVGLIPAGGGTKEMLARARRSVCRRAADSLPFVQRVFETIGFGRVSSSGADARRLGYLRDVDGVTMNRERLIADAKAQVLARAANYVPPQPAVVRAGGEGVLRGVEAWRPPRVARRPDQRSRRAHRPQAGRHPVRRALASNGTVTEQQLLDLEREAFLSLCGERRTQERIAHTLKTGKTLRN